MSKPVQWTTSQQSLLRSYLISSSSDSFFLGCKQLVLPGFLDGIFSSLLDWVSFYFIGMASIFLILIIPVIFFFQASGKQKKMQRLYNRSRLQLIKFLYICVFANMASPIMAWIIGQPGPCMHENEKQKSIPNTIGLIYQTPSVDMVIETIIGLYFLKYGDSILIFFDETFGSFFNRFKQFSSSLLMKFLGIFFIAFFAFYEVWSGRTNVLQVLFSFFFGLVIHCFIDYAPIIISFSVLCVLGLICIAFLCCNRISKITSYLYDDYWEVIIAGFSYLAFDIYLLVYFLKVHGKQLKWFDTFSSFLEDDVIETENNSAIFGELEVDEQEEVQVSFKSLLINDLMHSGIAFLIQNSIQAIEALIVYYQSL